MGICQYAHHVAKRRPVSGLNGAYLKRPVILYNINMEKTYYTIGEVADIIGGSVSLVRFWSDKFHKYLRPARNAKGNRLFTPGDIECLRQIRFLVKEEGLTLDGAAKRLAADRRPIERKVKALEILKDIRSQLAEVRKSM